MSALGSILDAQTGVSKVSKVMRVMQRLGRLAVCTLVLSWLGEA